MHKQSIFPVKCIHEAISLKLDVLITYDQFLIKYQYHENYLSIAAFAMLHSDHRLGI